MYIKVAVLIENEDKFLFVKESTPYLGKSWNWPQGKVEECENLEAAAIREGFEETGLTLRIEKKLDVLTQTFPDTKELHVFLATVVGVDRFLILPPEEILDAVWLSRDGAEKWQEEFVGNWILDTLKNHIELAT